MHSTVFSSRGDRDDRRSGRGVIITFAVAFAAFALALIPVAPVAATSSYQIGPSAATGNIDYGKGPGERLGVILANRPGGLYMGRLFVGDVFDAVDQPYVSLRGSDFFPAHVKIAGTDNCLWVGPSNGLRSITKYHRETGGSAATCAPGQLAWLHDKQNARTITAHVNCPLPSDPATAAVANWGGYTYTTRPSKVYYNAAWRWQDTGYRAEIAGSAAGTIPAGTGVFYRYTANGEQLAAVFLDGNSGGYGWAFIDAAAVPKVNYWSKPEAAPEYRSYDCHSGSEPGTAIAPPEIVSLLAWLDQL